MRVAAFTSLTTSYLPNGRCIARSAKAHHPDWDFFLLFNDRTPSFIRWEDEPFDHVVFADWLGIPRPWKRWAHGYSVVEFCTATKGAMSELLLDAYGYDAVVYLDPDTYVFSPLHEVIEILVSGEADVVLTPHITDREYDAEGIWSHEMAALKHGTFNLGFFAIANRKNGREFLRWWTERLIDHSQIDFQSGLFTDQKWANLAPYMFDGVHVTRDRAYNVATWNMMNREIERDPGGNWTVNGKPLRFYHFSGFGHDFAWADRELRVFARGKRHLIDLWNFYKKIYKQNALPEPAPPWHWGRDAFGRTITPQLRERARETASPDPYEGNI